MSSSSKDYRSVHLQIDGTLGILSLNRPDALNSLNSELCAELLSALGVLAKEDGLRALLLRAEGRAFCAGQDLKEVSLDEKLSSTVESIVRERCNPIVETLHNYPLPTVAAVQGVAAGAGAGLALCCDIVVAAESASFIQAFSKIGLVPDTGITFTLPRLIGWGRAQALCLLGEKLPSKEAERLGLLYAVYDDADFQKRSKELALRVAALPTQALLRIRQAFRASAAHTISEQLALEAQLQAECAATEDFREGVAAFLEKRTATFQGK